MMSEHEMRARIVEEAKSWLLTPYHSGALVKGRRGGTDCAMLLVGVYGNVGVIPNTFRPEQYSPQWHVNRNEEHYLNYILRFAEETMAPPARIPLPGDVVLFKISKLFAHGAIIIDWPLVIHAIGNDHVMLEDISRNTTGRRALASLPKRFFKPHLELT